MTRRRGISDPTRQVAELFAGLGQRIARLERVSHAHRVEQFTPTMNGVTVNGGNTIGRTWTVAGVVHIYFQYSYDETDTGSGILSFAQPPSSVVPPVVLPMSGSGTVFYRAGTRVPGSTAYSGSGGGLWLAATAADSYLTLAELINDPGEANASTSIQLVVRYEA